MIVIIQMHLLIGHFAQRVKLVDEKGGKPGLKKTMSRVDPLTLVIRIDADDWA